MAFWGQPGEARVWDGAERLGTAAAARLPERLL